MSDQTEKTKPDADKEGPAVWYDPPTAPGPLPDPPPDLDLETPTYGRAR